MDAAAAHQKFRTSEKQSRPKSLVLSDVVLRHRRQSGRTSFLVLQLFNIGLLMLVSEKVSAFWLCVNGIVTAALYAKLILNEFRCSREQIQPFVAYLASGVMRLGIGTCWASAAYGSGHLHALRFGPQSTDEYLMEGQLILTLGDWCIVLGWTLWEAWNLPRQPAKVRARHDRQVRSPVSMRVAIATLAFGWLVKLMVAVGIPLFSLGNFVSLFVRFSSPAAIYLLYLNIQALPSAASQRYYLMLVAVLLVEGILALSSYMKSATLVLIIAVGLCITHATIKRYREKQSLFSPRAVLVGCLFAFFVVLILFPFSQIRRSSATVASDGLEKTFGVSVAYALEEACWAAIPGTSEFEEMHRFPESGAWAFLARQSDVPEVSWSAKFADRFGTVSGMFVQDSVKNFIPRFLWPEKPPYYPGRKISVMNGFSDSVETATTSTGIGGIASSAILNYNYYALVLSCLLVGFIFAAYSACVARRVHTNPFATILFLAITTKAASHFDNVFDCGLDLCVYWLIVYLPMLWASNHIFDGGANNRRHLHN